MKFTITINFGRWIEDWEEAENLLGRGYGEGGICRVKDVSQSKSLTKLKAKLQELDQKERTYDEEFKAKEKFRTMRAGLEKQIADQHKREAANTNKVRYYYYLDYHC